jgi:hypothetical protein
MGVTGLWSLLNTATSTEEGVAVCLRADAAQLGALCAEVDGRVVAVDISELVVQAVTQPALREAGFSERGAVAKVTFERCGNYLRFGLTPVGVTEGRPPPEKMARLAQRHNRGAPSRRVTRVPRGGAVCVCCGGGARGRRARAPRACGAAMRAR